MFRNYLTVAIRNLVRHRVYSAINILGLAIGIACTVLISLYVRHEMAYDTFHPDAERICRRSSIGTSSGPYRRDGTARIPRR